MFRVILYAYGKICKQNINKLQDCEIIAVADRNVKNLSEEEKSRVRCPFILPEDIESYEYDYIAISSPMYFETVKQQLVCEHHIEVSKIVSMQLLLDDEYKNQINDSEIDYLNLTFENGAKALNYIPSEEEKKVLKEEGYTTRYSSVYYDVYAKDIADNTANATDIPQYVVTHKDYTFEKHPGYVPIGVGGYSKNNILTDSTGDNIIYLNNKINEMTAIYWVWKNRPTKYVGFCHYRRFFYDNSFRSFENYLRVDTAYALLQEYDIIVYERGHELDFTIEKELKGVVSEKAYDIGCDIIVQNIRKIHPEYELDFYEVMKGNSLYYFNMFITSWEIFDEFASWLFSIIIPSADMLNDDDLEGEDKRIVGFFAERMLSVWLHHNPMKVKTLSGYFPRL